MAPVVPLGPSVIAGASSLLGGVFGRSKQPGIKKQYRLGRENTELLEKNKYKWIVEGARKAGFNPLTALRATGGNITTAPQPQSPLSSRSYIGEAIKTFGGTYAQDAIQRATEARQNEEWQRRYDYQRENPVPLLSTRPQASKDADREKVSGIPENAGAMFPALDHRIQVRLPTDDGVETVYLHKHIADRFGIEEGHMLTVGDMSEMVGEIAGEGSAALQIDAVLENLFRQGIISGGKTGGEQLRPPINTRRVNQTGGL